MSNPIAVFEGIYVTGMMVFFLITRRNGVYKQARTTGEKIIYFLLTICYPVVLMTGLAYKIAEEIRK